MADNSNVIPGVPVVDAPAEVPWYNRPALETIVENGPAAIDKIAEIANSNPRDQIAQALGLQQEVVPNMDMATQNKLFNGVNPPAFAKTADNGLVTEPSPEELLAQQPLNPATDFLDSQATQSRVKEQKSIDMASPLYSKIKAQDDLNNAAQVLEGNRQKTLGEKEMLQQQQVQEYQKFKQKYDADVSTRLMELDNQLKKVDEDARLSRQSTADLFQDKSSGQKIAAGLAIVLGAAGGVMRGDGRNTGLEVINDTLERERKQLLSNFANSKEMVELKRKNLDDYNEAMMRQMQVADRQKILQMQVLATKLDVAESQYRGSAAGAAAKDAKANIQMQINALSKQQAQSESLQNLMRNMGKGGRMPTPLETLGLPKEFREAVEDSRGLTVEGYSGIARNKEDRDAFNKFRQSQEPAIDALNRIIKLQKSGNRFNPEQRAQAASEINAAIGGLREAIVGPGAMTESEFERIRNTIGDQNKLFSLPSWEMAKTVTALNKLKSDLSTVANLRGFQPPQEFRANFTPAKADEIAKKYKYLDKK
jgi:hypothetical protein